MLMRTIRIFIVGLLLNAGWLGTTSAETNTVFTGTSDWAYHRVYTSYVYLLRHADLPKAERDTQCHSAYRTFFEYWLLHHSKRSTQSPVLPFEEHFGRLVRREVLGFVDRDDPM